ncbi:MAG: V-type ATP synthase subunit F [Methanospirillaceae archaeon]|nr:V-type ATP synthase subunit F [Methanospirillaceae archaeon]
MRVAVIGKRDAALGFSLAGVRDSFRVTTQNQAEAAFLTCTGDPTIGIILIDTGTSSLLAELIQKVRRAHRLFPVILTIPGGEHDNAGIVQDTKRGLTECMLKE